MRTTCAALAAVLAAGCGPGNIAPVSGVVVLDGRPLDGAQVTFQPIDGREPGPGSRAQTGPDGRFALATFDRKLAGAVVGRHRVTISKAGGDDTSALEAVPPRYNDASDVTFTVPRGGTDKADFELSSR